IIQKAFKMGVKVWSDVTCINFVEDKNAHDKVVVIKGNGSWSSVGRMGGEQLFSLEDSASEGTAVHEIGHVLGLYHTMQRYDRDNFTMIIMQNVDVAYIEEFDIMRKNFTDVYGLTYDYGSVMHYGELSFSANEQPTMIAKDPLYQKTMGSDLISFSDIFMINEHYGCNVKCNKSTSAKCVNEGYPHPRNCSICICPSGYGGPLCDRRPPGCGGDLVATSVEKVLIGSLGIGIGLRDQFTFCHYMITVGMYRSVFSLWLGYNFFQARGGKRIVIHVQLISSGYDEPGCTKGGVEVKAQKDQKLTGYRFCSRNGSEIPITSSSNRLPVILFNRFGKMDTMFTYRHI
ncbi:hypothetical protein Angca_010268, partial [Angiostrongylus cantonensis]